MKKIAVTYENGQVFQHFGHTEKFKVYSVADGAVKSAAILSAGGSGHGAMAGLLADSGVDTLICGGIGGGARAALAQAGIQLYGGVSGDAGRFSVYDEKPSFRGRRPHSRRLSHDGPVRFLEFSVLHHFPQQCHSARP